MQALIDSDVLLYEIGFAAEASWKALGLEGLPSWDFVEEMLTMRINNICAVANSDEPPILFLTGSTNFRTKIAYKQKYKDRPSAKPWHYYNIKAFIKATYDYRETEGLEADDLMAIEQTSRGCSGETIICSRDKDLKQVRGWGFSWELRKQAQFGPMFFDGYGFINLSEDRKSIKGYGDKFFLSQCLTGDVVDSIPGLPKCGPVKAFELLEATSTYADGLEAVREAYRGFYGGVIVGDEALTEQARLLWMVRELNPDGSPVMWSMYD